MLGRLYRFWPTTTNFGGENCVSVETEHNISVMKGLDDHAFLAKSVNFMQERHARALELFTALR